MLLHHDSPLKAGLHPTTLRVNLPQTLQQTGVLHNQGTAAALQSPSTTLPTWLPPTAGRHGAAPRGRCGVTQPGTCAPSQDACGLWRWWRALGRWCWQRWCTWHPRCCNRSPGDWSAHFTLHWKHNNVIIIIMYIYHVLINALNTHMIYININTIFYTHVEHSPTTRHSRVWHLELLPLIPTGNYKQIWNMIASIKISTQRRDVLRFFNFYEAFSGS